MTQTPNIPPMIESDEREYQDTGVPSTVAIRVKRTTLTRRLTGISTGIKDH